MYTCQNEIFIELSNIRHKLNLLCCLLCAGVSLTIFRMTQWDRLRQLPAVYTQHLHELYDRDTLPMDVRHYLAAWIEKQEW